MPEITESTPREDITIAGKTFSVPAPYAAGHVLTTNEAASLNQTFAENIRNNKAKFVKEAVEAGTFDQSVFQGQVDDYSASYEFGVRTGGGGRTSDPVMAEALDIARDMVRKAIVKKGLTLKDYPAAKITELAKANIAKNPEILATAKARVEEAASLSDVSLDGLDSPQAGDTAAAPAKKAKADAAA